MSSHCPLLPWLQVSWGPFEFRRKQRFEAWVGSSERLRWVLCLEAFYLSLAAGILKEVLGEAPSIG